MPPDPTRPVIFRLTRETRNCRRSGHLNSRNHSLDPRVRPVGRVFKNNPMVIFVPHSDKWPGCGGYGWMRICEHTFGGVSISDHDTKGVRGIKRFSNHAGGVGSGQEVFKSHGSGRVSRFSNLTGRAGSGGFQNLAGRVSSADSTRADP